MQDQEGASSSCLSEESDRQKAGLGRASVEPGGAGWSIGDKLTYPSPLSRCSDIHVVPELASSHICWAVVTVHT